MIRSFLDTNVLVYLFDSDAPEKQRRARELLDGEVHDGRAVLSTQVLQEFYVAATRKLARPLSEEQAGEVVRELSMLPIVNIDAELVLSGIERSRSARLSFWDALIIDAAIAGSASRLYSEDLQHGQRFDGLEVINPFL